MNIGGCTKELDPVCCTDKFGIKTEFDNPCLAEQEGGFEDEDCEMGQCPDCVCTDEYDPYCCWGKTYDNPCLAECAGITNPEDKCDYQGECTEGGMMLNVLNEEGGTTRNYGIIIIEMIIVAICCMAAGISIPWLCHKQQKVLLIDN